REEENRDDRVGAAAAGSAQQAPEDHDQRERAEQAQGVRVDRASGNPLRQFPERPGLRRKESGALEDRGGRGYRDSGESRADRPLAHGGARPAQDPEERGARGERGKSEEALAD